MTRRMQLLLGCLGVLATSSSAMATDFLYSPTQGKPWTSGLSSFDFTNWSFADNVLGNNAGSARTWTVPVTISGSAIVPITMSAVMANSIAGNTTGQIVTNFPTGARMTSGTVVTANNTSLTDKLLGSGTVPIGGTAYVNFVVASGGRLARIKLTQ